MLIVSYFDLCWTIMWLYFRIRTPSVPEDTEEDSKLCIIIQD